MNDDRYECPPLKAGDAVLIALLSVMPFGIVFSLILMAAQGK